MKKMFLTLLLCLAVLLALSGCTMRGKKPIQGTQAGTGSTVITAGQKDAPEESDSSLPSESKVTTSTQEVSSEQKDDSKKESSSTENKTESKEEVNLTVVNPLEKLRLDVPYHIFVSDDGTLKEHIFSFSKDGHIRCHYTVITYSSKKPEGEAKKTTYKGKTYYETEVFEENIDCSVNHERVSLIDAYGITGCALKSDGNLYVTDFDPLWHDLFGVGAKITPKE